MALIGTLRNKMGKIVVGAIMVTMLSFILTDLIGNSSLLGGQTENPDIAEMAGKTITNANFQSKVDELSYYFALNSGKNPTQQEIEQIRDQAWNALILESAYQNQFDELGLVVTNTELIDIVQGNNISPEIKSFFTDPQTGQFSLDNLTTFLNSLSQAPPQQQAAWISLENSLQSSRLVSKYQTLLSKTNYVTQHEAEEEYKHQNTIASIEYVFVPYLTMNDSTISVTEDELEDYMEKNKQEYQRKESRDMQYVIFDIVPSSEDSAIVKEETVAIKKELEMAQDDSSYVAINSDDPEPFLTYQIDELPAPLKNGDTVKQVGFVSKPKIVNGHYEFYKLSNIETLTQDSVLYKVAKIRKEFFVSDETTNNIYRQADLFAASSSNTEEFQKNAEEQGYKILKASNIDRNARQAGSTQDSRNLVLWLYNDAKKGAVSDVKEVNDFYVVMTMTDIQEEGTARLESVRNQVSAKVRNQKKGKLLTQKLNDMDVNELSEMATLYGEEARTATVDVPFASNSISSVGYAPKAIGLIFALEEEETTKAFEVRDGVVTVKLLSKDEPESQDNYAVSIQRLTQKRQGFRTLIADFPLSYFKVYINKNIDSAIKKFADIEDMRYKFF